MKGNCHIQLRSENLKSENECVVFEIFLSLIWHFKKAMVSRWDNVPLRNITHPSENENFLTSTKNSKFQNSNSPPYLLEYGKAGGIICIMDMEMFSWYVLDLLDSVIFTKIFDE